MTSFGHRVNYCITIFALLAKSGYGQDSPINFNVASQYFQEAQALCSADKGRLWGVSLCGPMLFVDRQTREVVASQTDREGFLTRQGDVFVGQLPEKVNTANTAIEWAGVHWTMIIFPLPEDKIRRANLMAHELWHRLQNDIGFPGSGAANNHLDTKDGRVWLQLEWRALSVALMSSGKQRRRAISDALTFRAYRRTLFPKAASEEREMEMHEGLAEYTGVRLSGAANLNEYLIEGALKQAPQKKTFVRSFAYATGPAYGLLLDSTHKEWRRGLKKDDDLGNLLIKILRIKLAAKLEVAAAARARTYDGEALIVSETDRENQQQKLIADYRARLVDGPVLLIPLQKMNMQFNPGNLVPLDSLGTIYPDIRIVDVWGILTVSSGGALMNSTYSKLSIQGPENTNGSLLRGPGWTLELNPGWAITPGERTGDYVLRKPEQ